MDAVVEAPEDPIAEVAVSVAKTAVDTVDETFKYCLRYIIIM